ncbi:hypothetical protein OCB09_10820 [Bacillus cereus]|uniref:hypothetical protein n=1 Tax=Bacillus cereus TaxID=1396 RepID=UPI0018F2B50E|nr:hypothetical protein [Bacillus cereus]MBJ7935527.1 hypothetical protein [Bacillus cereus]MCU5503851.1 hypothetical protein [Bacillus cereus]
MIIKDINTLSSLSLLMEFEEVVQEIAKGNDDSALVSYQHELFSEIEMRMSEGYDHDCDPDEDDDDMEEDMEDENDE